MTVTRPTSDRLRMFGIDPARHLQGIKRCLGVVPQTYTLGEDLSSAPAATCRPRSTAKPPP
jgi:ABC-type multidrug transport system ATPase subunit